MVDRSRWLDFEAHRIVDVFAHYGGTRDRKYRCFRSTACRRQHAAAATPCSTRPGACRAARPSQEQRFGAHSTYAGSEIFLSLREPADLDDEERVRELSVRALVSNRHLTEQLPVGEAGADFHLTRRHVAAAALRRRADAAA